MAFDPDIYELFQGIKQGNKVFLARAITLIESTLPIHQSQSLELLKLIWPHQGQAMKIAVTGAPGVGKSSMIEVLGAEFIRSGHKVAVLAIDPTSQQSYGSILGDKTRMNQLAQMPAAFVRPSPNSLELGGVSPSTRESIVLCEAAGYDIVLLETVGVGQSEIQVSDMADIVLLLLAPGSGDHLQGIKKGIMESADLIAITKADGELENAANRLQSELKHSAMIRHQSSDSSHVQILLTSSHSGKNITELMQIIQSLFDNRKHNGVLEQVRRNNLEKWFDQALRISLLRKAFANEQLNEAISDIKSSRDFTNAVIPLVIQDLLKQWDFRK